MLNLIAAFLLIGFTSFASSSKNDPLHFFDKTLVQTEETECLKAKSSKEWISSEIKRLTVLTPISGASTKLSRERDVKVFKIDDKPLEASWEMGSPDTQGDILKAQLVDLNGCTPLDIQKHKDLENKVWLVEETSAIPDLLALTLEAKFHKALGLIIYGDSEDAPKDENLALPVLRITKKNADALKAQLKEKTSSVEISLKAESPVKKSTDWVTAKSGAREVSLGVVASNLDCKAIGLLLTLMDWQKRSATQIQGTIFGFLADDDLSPLGPVALIMKVEPDHFDAPKFLRSWIKADQELANVIDGKTVIKRALAETSDFQGLIDKEILTQYKSDLKTLENIVKIKPDVAFKLKNLYQTDELPTLALDLKNLKLVHDLAQKGQWEKAVLQFKRIHDYQWATNVSAATFLEYRRLTQKDLSVNGALWGTLQKGRNSLDAFIEAVETEIDRLEQVLSDNFFKIHKSVENLEKI